MLINFDIFFKGLSVWFISCKLKNIKFIFIIVFKFVLVFFFFINIYKIEVSLIIGSLYLFIFNINN